MMLCRYLIYLCALVSIVEVGRAYGHECSWPANRKLPRALANWTTAPRKGNQAWLPRLGRVLQLDTILGPKDVIATKFVIHRRGWQRRVQFKPTVIDSYEYQYNITDLFCSSFDPNLRTFVLIAGFLTEESVEWMTDSVKHLLQLEDVNVIEVTWSDANRYLYSSAVAATPIVARQITILLYYLSEIFESSLSNDSFVNGLTFVGHSLGAHICGFVGQDLWGPGSRARLGRIIGLDPAGPSFDKYTELERLDPSDARLVQVIHTNRGTMRYLNAAASFSAHMLSKIPLINQLGDYLSRNYTGEGNTAWYGIDANVGHVDYYANNGKVQPGCMDFVHICDHGRATEIFERLLAREVQLRSHGLSDFELEKSRILAFKSIEYDDFQLGRNFEFHCRSLITNKSINQLKYCSLPIEFFAPVDEVIKEFRDHGVNFCLLAGKASEYKYFFKTLDGGILVNDHYMLKLHIYHPEKWDESSCSLEISFEIHGKEVSLDVTDIRKSKDYHNNLDTIALTFVHPDENSRKILNELLHLELEQLDTERRLLLEHLLPGWIKLKITERKSKSVRSNLSEKTIRWFKTKYLECRLDIDRIEIHPLIESDINFSAIYDIDGSDNPPILPAGKPLPNKEVLQLTATMDFEGARLKSFLMKSRSPADGA